MNNSDLFEPKARVKTIDLVNIAMGATLIAICSWIRIPTIVPFTLQTFAVFFVLLTMGGRRGTLAVLIYVLIGLLGMPVFSGFTGGIGVVLGSTGGYIIGFVFIGLIYASLTGFFGHSVYVEIWSLIVGLIACYIFGSAWFMMVYAQESGPVGFLTVLKWCVFPIIIPDIGKLALAYMVSKKVRHHIM